MIDLSTNSPDVVRTLADDCRAAGVRFVDAPVSGGVAKAVSGELSVMVGASAEDHAEVEPLLASFATSVFHVGPTGAGTVAKLVNNQLFLGAAVLVQEAYLLAAANGLSPNERAPDHQGQLGRRRTRRSRRCCSAGSSTTSSSASTSRRRTSHSPSMPPRAAGVDAPVTAAAAALYADAVESGFGRLVFHATLRELEQTIGSRDARLRADGRAA